MMKRYAFIACSKRKKSSPCRAKEFYQGELFKKSLYYCLSHQFDNTFILSAKYGLVALDQVLEPYDLTLKNLSKRERWGWSQKVKLQLHECGIVGEFWFFTGVFYREFFDGVFPLEGLTLGYQLKWFKDQISNTVTGFNL